MTIDTETLRERLPSFDYVIYTNSEGIEPAADGEYVLAADAHERLEAAADRLAALEADKAQLISDLEDALQAGLAASVEAHRLEAENQRLRQALGMIENFETDSPHDVAMEALSTGGRK